MGARVCGEPAPIVYKEFVQPVMLSNMEIATAKPYSFGMSIADDYGNPTAWQAFDSDALSMWELISSKPSASLTITFEHPVLLEEFQAVWEKPAKVLAFSAAGYNAEGVGVGIIVMATGANASANSFTVKNPKEVKSVKITVGQ